MPCSTDPFRRAIPRRHGFSLIEVLLAVSIAIGLFFAVLLFYRHTAETRETVTEHLAGVGDARRVFQQLTIELRGVAHPDNGVSFSGSSSSISFATATVPGQGYAENLGLVLVDYATRHDDENGIVGLTRAEQAIRHANANVDDDDFTIPSRDEDNEAAEHSPLVISDHIRFIRLRYLDGDSHAWQDSWQSDEELPAAVQVMLAPEPADAELEPEEYPDTVYRRTISLGYTVPGEPDESATEDEDDDEGGNDIFDNGLFGSGGGF